MSGFIEIGIVVTIVLFLIGTIKGIYDKYIESRNKALKDTDETLCKRVSKLEDYHIKTLEEKATNNYITREEFASTIREIKIEIKAEFKEVRDDFKSEFCEVRKKLDTIRENEQNFITIDKCKENQLNGYISHNSI